MGDIEFYGLIVKYWDVYLYSFAICFFIYYKTYKRVFLSLLDPLNFNILYSFLGASVVFFLFFVGEINTYYFSSYCLTQTAFLIGFFIFRPIKIDERKIGFGKEKRIKGELYFLQIVFIISSLFHLMGQLYVYSVRGIPLFMQSYLDTYDVGGGFGTFSRIITGSTIISWYLLIHFFINGKVKKIKIYLWTYMIVSLGFFSLSGSKATFLTIALILFIYTLINCRFNTTIQVLRQKIEKFSLKLFIAVCIMVLIIISVKSSEGENPLLELGIRLIHSGDAYYYGYPNDVLNNIDKGSSFNALFSDILGMFRIVNWEKLPQSFGLLLYRYHYPQIDYIAGANARHNIFGLFYFGYLGSILFSFILGFILSFCRNYLYRNLPRNILFGIFYTFLYLCIVTFESDICLALFMFDSYILTFILIYILSFFIFYSIKKPANF